MKEGWLHKLSGGATDGQAWKRRYFVLRGSTLLYFTTPAAGGSFSSPNGVVLLVGCNIAARPASSAGGKFELALEHAGGDTLVLAADAEAERDGWVAALSSAASGGAARPKPPPSPPKADSSPAAGIEAELEAAAAEHANATARLAEAKEAKRSIEAQVRIAREGLARRQALLHWRERQLSTSFSALVMAAARRAADAQVAGAEAGGAPGSASGPSPPVAAATAALAAVELD